MKKYNKLIKLGQTHAGTPLISVDELIDLINSIEGSGIYPYSMEAFFLDNDGIQVPLMEYSVLGIDVGYDTSDDDINPIKQIELFRKKAALASISKLNVLFNVWLDNINAD